MLCNVWWGYNRAVRTRGNIFKRDDVRHPFPGEWCAVSDARSMDKDIAFAGYTKHAAADLTILERVQSMFPEATGARIVRMKMDKITGYGQRLIRGSR